MGDDCLHNQGVLHEKWHFTINDALGHRNFIKGMIIGGVALITVPADGNFTAAVAKSNRKAHSDVFIDASRSSGCLLSATHQ